VLTVDILWIKIIFLSSYRLHIHGLQYTGNWLQMVSYLEGKGCGKSVELRDWPLHAPMAATGIKYIWSFQIPGNSVIIICEQSVKHTTLTR